ncbi:MAG: dihydrolipoyl dehydrogenase [Phycisphaerae bacterium]|nr:dihydrolipoyl dehydrogenase [Phycisphaerae bacterium]
MAEQASTREAQVVVIGAGPGGYAAAFCAADLGLRVTLVNETHELGGVCLQRGCIPSKALLHVAKLLNESREAAAWGLRFAEPEIDIEALRGWKQGVVDQLSEGVAGLAKRRGVEVIQARASFVDSQTLKLEGPQGGSLRFEHAILAVGSVPAMPKLFQIDDPRIMDSTGALALADVPKRLLVVGGGYIGLEMGSVYAALGSRVVVVEMLDGLLPGADRDLVRPLEARLRKQFEAIHLHTKVTGVRAEAGSIVATLEGEGIEPEQTFDRVLVAVGRRPNSAGIGIENTQVVVDERGFVEVDEQMRTADPHILAIGDIAGEPMLAHKASHEARVAAEFLAGQPACFDKVAIPAVVFTDPELAWCGLTETAAKAAGREVKVARFPWAASGRALTLGRTEGVTKLIFDPETERILGVGIVGVGAGELIAEGTLAVEMGAVAHDVAETIHAHPTLSETVGEGAEAFLGSATHIYTRRR